MTLPIAMAWDNRPTLTEPLRRLTFRAAIPIALTPMNPDMRRYGEMVNPETGRLLSRQPSYGPDHFQAAAAQDVNPHPWASATY